MSKKRKASDRQIVVGLADEHAGHWLGLLSPDAKWKIETPDGEEEDYQPALTRTQRYLWDDVYTWAIKEVFALADGCPLHVVNVGDVAQGGRYGKGMISVQQGIQETIALYNLLPWFDYSNLKSLVIVIGTGAHNYGEGDLERSLARTLKLLHPKQKITSAYHARLTICGATIDTAHHGPYPGSRQWIRGNIAKYYLKDAMLQDISLGKRPADVYLRAHYHTYLHVPHIEDWGGKEYESHLIICPALCGMNDHARQTTRSAFVQTHGLVAFEVEKGKPVQVHSFKKMLDLRTELAIG